MRLQENALVKYWIGVLQATLKIWLQAQSIVYAAALAFFTVFSMAPVLIMVVMLVGLVFGESAAQGQLASHLQSILGGQAAEMVQTAIQNSQLQKTGLFPALAGFAAMMFGATTVFVQMQGALNSIWGVASKSNISGWMNYLVRRTLSLVVVLGIGFVLLVSMTLSVALSTVMTFAQGWIPIHPIVIFMFDWIVSLAVTSLLFAAIYRILPDVVLAWRDVLLGGFVTALLFMLGRALIAWYLSRAAPASTYGAAGSLVLLLMWVNYSSLILLFGSAFTRAQLQARGGHVTPRANAALVKRDWVEVAP